MRYYVVFGFVLLAGVASVILRRTGLLDDWLADLCLLGLIIISIALGAMRSAQRATQSGSDVASSTQTN